MDTRSAFDRIMAKQPNMALATISPDGTPNVRVVNFCWRADTGFVYFSTFPDNAKVTEIGSNPHVAFTTVPTDGNAHVRAHGICRRSPLAVCDVVEAFARESTRVPDHSGTVRRPSYPVRNRIPRGGGHARSRAFRRPAYITIVHALFFSQDAVSLETMLHHEFEDRRVNKVNVRKEFYYCTPQEVLDKLREKDIAVVEYKVEPEAEEYRISRSLAARHAATA